MEKKLSWVRIFNMSYEKKNDHDNFMSRPKLMRSFAMNGTNTPHETRLPACILKFVSEQLYRISSIQDIDTLIKLFHSDGASGIGRINSMRRKQIDKLFEAEGNFSIGLMELLHV